VPGLQEPYEAPLSPDLVIDTTALLPEAAADQIVALIRSRDHDSKRSPPRA